MYHRTFCHLSFSFKLSCFLFLLFYFLRFTMNRRRWRCRSRLAALLLEVLDFFCFSSCALTSSCLLTPFCFISWCVHCRRRSICWNKSWHAVIRRRFISFLLLLFILVLFLYCFLLTVFYFLILFLLLTCTSFFFLTFVLHLQVVHTSA